MKPPAGGLVLARRGVAYGRVREPIQSLLILLAALIVSPLGYLLIGPLTNLTDRAAGSLF